MRFRASTEPHYSVPRPLGTKSSVNAVREYVCVGMSYVEFFYTRAGVGLLVLFAGARSYVRACMFVHLSDTGSSIRVLCEETTETVER